MTSKPLQKAREFEARYGPLIPEDQRPAFHLTPNIGWMNDPNGFSCYQGEYHLFYQYHPYSTEWGPMHWGHAKTRDFLHWERLPAAMAPDQDYDRNGCFSGSAVELDDGRQMLVYTAVHKHLAEDGQAVETQTQCLAFGDGVNYEKWPGNPVITAAQLPEGGSKVDFRDPKVWREPDGSFRLVVGNRPADGSGAVLLYQSRDGIDWSLVGTVDASHSQYGQMWECPDFFPLDGKQVLFVSPQEMSPIGLEFHAGNGTVCLIGSYDADANRFTREAVQAIDYGIDFYAPQTLLTPDGRRVMIGWLQNWNTLSVTAPDTSVLKIDRTRSGSNADVVHTRSLLVRPRDGRLKLRILMDRFSVEIFANDGETAASMAIFTRQEASAISFGRRGAGADGCGKIRDRHRQKGNPQCLSRNLTWWRWANCSSTLPPTAAASRATPCLRQIPAAPPATCWPC